jgi:phage baseplate assembly protein W
MPLEGISRGFKDISFSFQTHPLTGDLITLSNETAIARSLQNLINTGISERLFNQDLGCNVKQSLFENIDIATGSIIETYVTSTIKSYEPRVSLKQVSAIPDPDNNNFNIIVTYEIVGLPSNEQEITFALESGR